MDCDFNVKRVTILSEKFYGFFIDSSYHVSVSKIVIRLFPGVDMVENVLFIY